MPSIWAQTQLEAPAPPAQSRLAEGGGALGQAVDLARAVKQRVLGVDVKMGAGGRGHRSSRILGPGPDGAIVRSRSLRTPAAPVRRHPPTSIDAAS